MEASISSWSRQNGDEKRPPQIGVLGTLSPELLDVIEREGELCDLEELSSGLLCDAVVLGPTENLPLELATAESPAVIRLVSEALVGVPGHRRYEIRIPAGATPEEFARAIHDAVEIRRLERELNEVQQAHERMTARYEAALRASKTGIWRWDLRTGRIEWSPQLHEIFGLAPGTFPGTEEAFYELLHPDDHARVREEVQAALTTGHEYEVEFRFLHSSGSYYWMEARGCGCFDADGSLIELVGMGIDITERKRSEARLQEHESILREIGDNLPNGALYQVMLCRSGERRFLYLGSSFERLTGVPVEEALSDANALYSLIYPGDAPLIRAVEDRCRNDKAPFEVEVRIRHRGTNEWRWVHMRSTPHDLPDGSCVWSGIYMDITERRRVDEVLAQTLERLDLAQRAGRVGVFDWDVSAGTVIWSEEEHHLFGVGPGAFDGTIAAWVRRLDRQDVRRLRQEIRSAVSRRATEMSFSFRIQHGVTGTIRWIEGAGRFSYDSEGELIRIVGVNQDVTDQKEAQQQLTEANRQLARRVAELEAVAHVLPVGIVIAHDAECSMVTVNPAMERMLRRKMPSGKVTNRETSHLGYIFDADGKEVSRTDMPMETAARTGQEVPAKEYEVRLMDGSTLHLLVNAAPLLNEDGTPRGAVAAAVDISETKRTQRALQAIDRRKNEFLAMLSHELRNPLAAIRNAMQVLGSNGSDVDDLEWATGVINRQSEQLTSLVDDLLDVARITRGRIELRKQTVDVASVLDQAIESVRGLVRERGHELRVDYPHDGTLLAEADRSRLEQIVVNLLTNAAKYTRNGGRIVLRARPVNGDIAISVSDNGIGIARDKLPEMFELFTQGERSIDRSEGGLGLGLTIVRQLAELHGGSATAWSEGVGKGSVFTVHIPVGHIAQPVPPSARDNESSPLPAARVLVIDDNMDTANGLAKLLSRRGYSVQVAYDGFAGMQCACAIKPDIMLVDLGLPGMTGYEVAEQVRSDEALRSTFLVAVSGYGQEEDCNRTRAAGFDHHFVKPVEFEQLEKLLRDRPVAERTSD